MLNSLSLVEPSCGVARELADSITVMGRGEVVMSDDAATLDEAAIRNLLTV